MELREFSSKRLRSSHRSQRRRTITLLVLMELYFAFLVYRLFSLQCIQGDDLRAQAELQHRKEIYLKAKRGNIYDRNMRPLAVNIKTYSLYADPSILEQKGLIAHSLSSMLSIPEKEFLRRLELGRRFVWLKRQLPDYVAEKIRSLEVEGLAFEEDEKRFYPKGSLASHVIGFVGLDGVGLEGIEKECDPYIKGSIQKFTSQRDRKGRDLIPPKIEHDNSTRGYDIALTIDEVIQHIAENALRSACKKWRSNGGSVIVMNPKTGEILALANCPDYDLNKAFSVSGDHRRNRATMDLYEPGSAFKIVTASAAINENAIRTDERFDCENGIYNINGFTVHDIGRYRQLTLSEIIENSSNIGIVKVANRLGKERLYNYIRSFGIGQETGVDLPEASGFVRPLENWTGRSMVAIPFGQELSVTALQMLCITNAIANDGIIMQPFVVRAIMYDQKTFLEFFPREVRDPISARTARIMRNILIRAVENGTGKNAQVNGYKVAGKTGTSQKASSKGYALGKYVSSFVGFLPADDPLISMIVTIDEPKGAYLGGIVACPVFKEIAAQTMQYLTVSRGIVSQGSILLSQR